MPPVWVYEGSDGVLEIINGATRATRIAKRAPGAPSNLFSPLPAIGRMNAPTEVLIPIMVHLLRPRLQRTGVVGVPQVSDLFTAYHRRDRG